MIMSNRIIVAAFALFAVAVLSSCRKEATEQEQEQEQEQVPENFIGIDDLSADNYPRVDGKDSAIDVFTRPRNSGSEETFRALVMGDLEHADFPESQQVVGMGEVFPEIRRSVGGICYTFENYKKMLAQIPDGIASKIAVDGIYPDKTTIGNRTYPFTTEVYAVIRSDLDPGSMAYKLYEWLQTESAKSVLEECGFSKVCVGAAMR